MDYLGQKSDIDPSDDSYIHSGNDIMYLNKMELSDSFDNMLCCYNSQEKNICSRSIFNVPGSLYKLSIAINKEE